VGASAKMSWGANRLVRPLHHMDTKKLGELGEGIACEYLVNKGFKILVKNYRINFGEIDIIAEKRQGLFLKKTRIIHFVEVKTIIDDSGNFFPEERVDYKKRKKLRQLAQIWLEKNSFPQNQPYQIDIIGVQVGKDIEKPKVAYFENVVGDN